MEQRSSSDSRHEEWPVCSCSFLGGANFQIVLEFSARKLGKMNPFLMSIFFGWVGNHQLVCFLFHPILIHLSFCKKNQPGFHRKTSQVFKFWLSFAKKSFVQLLQEVDWVGVDKKRIGGRGVCQRSFLMYFCRGEIAISFDTVLCGRRPETPATILFQGGGVPLNLKIFSAVLSGCGQAKEWQVQFFFNQCIGVFLGGEKLSLKLTWKWMVGRQLRFFWINPIFGSNQQLCFRECNSYQLETHITGIYGAGGNECPGKCWSKPTAAGCSGL